MRAMADQVVGRCIDHIASLDRQPACGDVDAAALCRELREDVPERGVPLEPLLDSLFRDWVPRSFTAPGPGYLAFIPGGGVYPAALADFITNTTNQFNVSVFDSSMNLVDSVIVNNSDPSGLTPDYDHAIDLTGVTGRYLRVATTSDSFLAISELQVFAAVPEPSALMFAGLGLVGLMGRRRANRRTAIVER